MSSTLSDRLRKYDGHSAVSNEFRVYTAQGAILSVMTILLVGYLVVTEFIFNFQVTLEERVHVNATSPRGLEMEFDISIPGVPCDNLNIDANDVNGQTQSLHLDQKHHVWKHRIKMIDDTNFEYIGDRRKIELGSTLLTESELIKKLEPHVKKKRLETDDDDDDDDDDEEECGSCYGAAEEDECCNTCDDVKRVYKAKGWILNDLQNVIQCKREHERAQRELEKAGRNKNENEGCNVHGKVALSSGGGNLHVAPNRDIEPMPGGGFNLFDMLLKTFQQWNVSHTLHKVRFGADFPEAINQLDEHKVIIKDGYGMYQYYVKVVPTLYRYLNGTTVQTNQYSVTEHLRHVDPGSSRGVPGVYFFYEVSPLHVEISEVYQKGYIAFFTSVCAIIGGVVTMMGMLDQCLFQREEAQKSGLVL